MNVATKNFPRGRGLTIRRGFTLTELLVAVGIIAVLCAILLPVLVSVRRKSYQTTCAANLRQLSTASQMYAQDNDGVLPHCVLDSTVWGDWFAQITPYVKNKQVFECPACVLPNNLGEEPVHGYAMNEVIYNRLVMDEPLIQESDLRFSASTVLFAEVHFIQAKSETPLLARYSILGPDILDENGWGPGYALDSETTIAGLPGAARHNGGSNYAFVDGNVKWYKPEAVDWRAHDENGHDLPPPDGTRPSFRL